MSRRAAEINKRVRALDRVVAETMANAPTMQELRELGGVSVPALNADVALQDHKLPLFTLEHTVQCVCIERRLTTWGWNLAIAHALRAHRSEPNLDVCATWAVDQVMSLKALARVDLVGDTLWKEGRPVGGINEDRALSNDALLQVREIPPLLRDIGGQVVLCDWQPEHASAGANLLFYAEEDRPPVEVMKLIADIKQMAKQGQINSCKIMAKDLVRTRAYIKKMHKMKSHMEAISLMMSSKYSEKVVGYAAVALMVHPTEAPEDLMATVVTAIKTDLDANDDAGQCLALACIAGLLLIRLVSTARRGGFHVVG